MSIKSFLGGLAWGVAAAIRLAGQTPAPPALLDDGRRFVAQLKLDAASDAVLFQATGLDRSKQLMEAVVSAGQGGGATLDDWANLHRALDGQAELALQRGDGIAAFRYLSSQEIDYTTLEHSIAATVMCGFVRI
jgi:hypothetical protein